MHKSSMLVALLGVAPATLAYIGPGAGISLLGSAFTFVIAVFLAIFAVLFWPIRKLLKRLKTRADSAPNQAASAGEKPTAESPPSTSDP